VILTQKPAAEAEEKLEPEALQLVESKEWLMLLLRSQRNLHIFLQIQADIAKYMTSINELKIEITKFQTKDMTELLSFHRRVESVLENLTDESQVLARCEGFPQKKLEAMRMAVALYTKLHGMITELQNMKIEPPLNQLLDKVERYFTKVTTILYLISSLRS
jgi:hypothetical protein